MKFVAKGLRLALIIGVSLLGGSLTAYLYLRFADVIPVLLNIWLPFVVGFFIFNFLARWWSFRNPPYLSEEWETLRNREEF